MACRTNSHTYQSRTCTHLHSIHIQLFTGQIHLLLHQRHQITKHLPTLRNTTRQPPQCHTFHIVCRWDANTNNTRNSFITIRRRHQSIHHEQTTSKINGRNHFILWKAPDKHQQGQNVRADV